MKKKVADLWSLQDIARNMSAVKVISAWWDFFLIIN